MFVWVEYIKCFVCLLSVLIFPAVLDESFGHFALCSNPLPNLIKQHFLLYKESCQNLVKSNSALVSGIKKVWLKKLQFDISINYIENYFIQEIIAFC